MDASTPGSTPGGAAGAQGQRILAEIEPVEWGRRALAGLGAQGHQRSQPVIERGRVVEEGTHPTLMAARGRYWDLLWRQEMEDELETADERSA